MTDRQIVTKFILLWNTKTVNNNRKEKVRLKILLHTTRIIFWFNRIMLTSNRKEKVCPIKCKNQRLGEKTMRVSVGILNAIGSAYCLSVHLFSFVL